MTEAVPLPDPSANWSYFLDVDGTLAEIAGSPDAVEVTQEVMVSLRRLYDATDGAMALVSGRPLTDLDRLFAPLHLPAVGQHGMEIRDSHGAVVHPLERPVGYLEIQISLRSFARHTPGILLEEKGYSLALHYRQAPDQARSARAAAENALVGHSRDYQILHGNMVLEIKPKGVNKGSAVRAMMKVPPYAGRPPVFAGDDITDEDGFAAVNDLGGVSIRVGTNGRTCARFRIGGVDDLVHWLSLIGGPDPEAGTIG